MSRKNPLTGPAIYQNQDVANRNRVVVSNGCHRFILYRAALACQQAGLLKHLITGWYLGSPRWRRALQSRAFARIFGPGLAKRLLGRQQAGIDPARVVSLLLPDLVERLDRGRLGRLGRPGMFSYLSMLAFGRGSKPYVREAGLFHVRSGYGRYAMAEAGRHGAVCLVDHSIADPKFMEETLTEEASRWGLPYQFPRLHWKCVAQDLDEADHILANSDFVRDTLVACRGLAPEKITVLTAGVDLQRVSPAAAKPAGGPFRLLFAGEIGLRKGILYLLKAFENLKLPDAELVMVGNIAEIGSLMPRLEAPVRHIPGLPYDDYVTCMQKASVFVFPSLVEGSARVVQEAMACGLPVITTPHAGSVVRDGIEGYVVPIRDVEALTARIRELYLNPERRLAMGQAALATAREKFAPQAYGDGLISLYAALLRPSAAPAALGSAVG